MDLSIKEILQFAANGGTSIIVLIIWVVTFRQQKFDQKAANEITAEAFNKHVVLNADLIQLLKDEQEYKTVLTGVLDRLSYKLETPAQCPILMTGKKFKFEVTE